MSIDAGDLTRESVRVYAATVTLIDRYPSDASVLVTLLLNHVVLAPGESLFVEPGVLHAYTAGFGLEIAASSDNVLRAGLTRKHVDVAELLDVADFTPTAPPRWTAVSCGPGVKLAPPVDEFELHVLDLHGEAAATLKEVTPRLALCLSGKVDLRVEGSGMSLQQGEAVFVEAASGPLAVTGQGRLAIGQTPLGASLT